MGADQGDGAARLPDVGTTGNISERTTVVDLKIEGNVVDVLEEQSGQGRNGPWRKQDFILETEGEYPAKVCITQWGENIEKFGIGIGDHLTAHIDIKSREYNGRWYTDVKAWRVEKAGGSGAPSSGLSADNADLLGPPPAESGDPGPGDDDLPF